MAAKTKHINPIPTGCPGPVKGTKLWACNGEDCPYGPYQYACCKQAIADRGYTLLLDKEHEEQMRQDAELIKVSLQAQLQDANSMLNRHLEQIANAQQLIVILQDEGDYKTELYIQELYKAVTAQYELGAQEQLTDSLKEKLDKMQEQMEADTAARVAERTSLLQDLVRFGDELAYHKQVLAQWETQSEEGEQGTAGVVGTGDNTGGDSNSTDAEVRDA